MSTVSVWDRIHLETNRQLAETLSNLHHITTCPDPAYSQQLMIFTPILSLSVPDNSCVLWYCSLVSGLIPLSLSLSCPLPQGLIPVPPCFSSTPALSSPASPSQGITTLKSPIGIAAGITTWTEEVKLALFQHSIYWDDKVAGLNCLFNKSFVLPAVDNAVSVFSFRPESPGKPRTLRETDTLMSRCKHCTICYWTVSVRSTNSNQGKKHHK